MPRSKTDVSLLHFVFAAIIAGVFACPVVTHAGLGSLSGGSGTSADLSSNPSIRHERLIVDPAPGSGSLTVLYDPSVVSIYSIYNAPNFEIDANNTYVGITYNNLQATAESYFAKAASVTESGRVQVAWTPVGEVAGGTNFLGHAPTNPTAFTTVASAGTTDGGVDTFGLEFTYLSSNPATLSDFTVLADAGGRPTINLFNGSTNLPPTGPDFLTDPNDPNGTAIPFSQISSVTVRGSLVPEPSALVLAGVGALAILAWRFRNVLFALFH
jgi:hypothetical protein